MDKASMRGVVLILTLATFVLRVPAQTAAIELANLHEDVRILSQRVGELQTRLEQLEHENRDLRTKNAAAAQSYATVAQLNDAVADLNRTIKGSSAATKSETLQQVGIQMEKLAKQTNAAIDSMSKAVSAATTPSRSPVAAANPVFSDDYPKEGSTYTVQKGDSLASIAKKTGGAPKDIINANKLADPSKIHAGQALFIPGGK